MELKKRSAALPGIMQAGIFLHVLTFCFFMSPSLDYAKMVTTPPSIVSGVVQEVGKTSLTVNRESYDVSRAVFVTDEGKKTFFSLIKPGDRVELVVEEGEVVKVRVDNKKIVK